MRRTARLILVAALLVAQAGLTLQSPGTAKSANSLGSRTHIIYLTGTSAPGTTASEFQSAYRWIHNSLADNARLAIPPSRQVVINYTNQNYSMNNSSPTVITSWQYSGTPVPLPSKCAPSVGPSVVDGWTHAFQAAWRIKKYIDQNNVSNVIIIGHSQGGTIARMLQVIANGQYSTGLPSNLPAQCWQDSAKKPLLQGKILGIVTVGAPLATNCLGFLSTPFKTERSFLVNSRTASGNALTIGGDPTEEVFGNNSVGKIPLNCATDVIGPGSRRVAIYSKGSSMVIQSVQTSLITSFSCPTGAGPASISLNSNADLKVGDSFTISGTTPSSWNGSYIVKAVTGTSGRTFQFCHNRPKPSVATKLGIVQVSGLQQHTWYIEGAGKCPAALFDAAPKSAKTDVRWCGYKIAQPYATWPVSWSLIRSQLDNAKPGTIYDLISQEIKRW
jgi:hypothetical protein